MLDVTGPIEVFTTANEFGGRYRVRIASEDGSAVMSSAGTRLGADLSVADVREPLDVLVVPGGPEWESLIKDDALLDVVRSLNEKSRCTASVCTGAFLLAAAGLLNGRRAATHWRHSRQLANRYPAVRVDPDAIFVRDGKMMTSAGVSAGIDLSLALVEEHYGAEVARSVAKDMVVFMQRPGGQSQFSVRARTSHTTQDVLRRLPGRRRRGSGGQPHAGRHGFPGGHQCPSCDAALPRGSRNHSGALRRTGPARSGPGAVGDE